MTKLIYNAAYTRSLNLTLYLLTWRIWWAPNNASRWQMGFNWAFKGLILETLYLTVSRRWTTYQNPSQWHQSSITRI